MEFFVLWKLGQSPSGYTTWERLRHQFGAQLDIWQSIRTYRARYWSASRSGALDAWSSPLKGLFISTIRKNPPETADAQIARLTITIIFRGARSPNVAKIMVAHAISTTNKGIAVELLTLEALFQRICPNSIAIPRAKTLSERWFSSFGDSS